MHFTATTQSRFLKSKIGVGYKTHTSLTCITDGKDRFVLGCISYLFMSAFEHNCEGPVSNQVFPVELKLPNSLHEKIRNERVQMCERVQQVERDVRSRDTSAVPVNPISSMEKRCLHMWQEGRTYRWHTPEFLSTRNVKSHERRKTNKQLYVNKNNSDPLFSFND